MSQSMDHKQNTPTPIKAIPENLPEELLPLYDWWKSKGPHFLMTLGTVALVAGGAWVFQTYRTNKISNANQEFLRANSLEELEGVVAKYGSIKVGNAARLRLAKAYFDAAKYEEALETYDLCIRKGVPDGFQAVADLGRAHALEALNRLDDALVAYEGFVSNQAEHFLMPQAKMGVARVYTLQGKKDEAKKLLENLKAEMTDKPAWEMAVANLEAVVARYEPRAARSLFEAADAASKAIAPVPAPATLTPTATPPTVEK